MSAFFTVVLIGPSLGKICAATRPTRIRELAAINHSLLLEQEAHVEEVGKPVLALRGAHVAQSYDQLPPVESEMRRRFWWMIYGGDRSWACAMDTPGLFSEAECGNFRPADSMYILGLEHKLGRG